MNLGYFHVVRAIHLLCSGSQSNYGDTDDVIATSDRRRRSCLGVQGWDWGSAWMRREPRLHNGQRARLAVPESQLAMDDNCGEGAGAHDHRRRTATGVWL